MGDAKFESVVKALHTLDLFYGVWNIEDLRKLHAPKDLVPNDDDDRRALGVINRYFADDEAGRSEYIPVAANRALIYVKEMSLLCDNSLIPAAVAMASYIEPHQWYYDHATSSTTDIASGNMNRRLSGDKFIGIDWLSQHIMERKHKRIYFSVSDPSNGYASHSYNFDTLEPGYIYTATSDGMNVLSNESYSIYGDPDGFFKTFRGMLAELEAIRKESEAKWGSDLALQTLITGLSFCVGKN